MAFHPSFLHQPAYILLSLAFKPVTHSMIKKIYTAVEYIQSKTDLRPEVGIVLGSGLGSFISELKDTCEIPYADIPGFPVSTVVGHSGKLILGYVSGKPVVAMAGRFHFYEGYGVEDIIFPIRVMKFLGIRNLLLSNAAGGTNATLEVGDLMIIRDHISLFAPNPLIGRNEDDLGTRFPDMSEPYMKDLRMKAKAIAAAHQINIKEGVYTGVTGPTFETRAEYKLIQMLGGDAVGMSTVQEVIAAVHLGLPVFAMSVITDIGNREDQNAISHEEVLEAAQEAEPKLSLIFKELIGQL